ncbi:MAG: aspartate aminotransferase family protein [Hyphomicrobiaceae bacterium]|nr:aspartate aminotransferase family protein [Hyphomicrobiaceae bacterium]
MPTASATTDRLPANASLEDALVEARATYTARNPKSHALQLQAERSLPGGNTRTVLFYGPFPLRFVKGEGCRLIDADGHTYVDFLAEYTAGMFGHSNPAIRKAIERALDFGVNIGGHTELEVRLAEAVTRRFTSMERVRFTNSGTEGNLMAVSLARAFTKRSKVMVFTGGYHGGVLYFRKGGSPVNAPFPVLVARYNDIASVRELADANSRDLACIIVEPMFGSTGCIQAEPEFLAGLRKVADETGALLILDEVMTSRLAPGGLQSLVGVKPDLTTLGKYVGGGMSFGAFGGRADVMALFDPNRGDALPHAGTFNNNTLTMSAGLAALTEAATPEAVTALNARGDRLRERLNAICLAAGARMQFTGRGSMMAVHFADGPIRDEADADRGNQDLKELLFFDLLDRGVYMARRGMIVLSLAQDEDAFAKLEAAVEDFVRLRKRFLA